MVNGWSLAFVLSVALTRAANGAEPDWRGAGGSIFVEIAEPAPTLVQPASSEFQVPQSVQPMEAEIAQAAARHGLDPKLLHALVAVESAYRVRAVSSADAGGLTQLMPRTAASLGVADRFDPSANLSAGADYLARQVARFGDLRLALAAYNAGPERIAAGGRVPDFPETRAYVDAVVDCYLALTAGRSIRTQRDCRRAGP